MGSGCIDGTINEFFGLSHLLIGRCDDTWVADYVAPNGDSNAVGIGFLRTNSGDSTYVGIYFVVRLLLVANEINGVGEFCVLE